MIRATQAGVAAEAVTKAGLNGTSIATIGITNQRETTIVWQDRRTAAYCDQLREAGHEQSIRAKTGLRIDAYFSGSKIRWILDKVPGARDLAKAGRLAFGTVDSWLIWNFTRGELHVTDVSNASRNMLPQVRQSSEVYCHTQTTVFASRIPILASPETSTRRCSGRCVTSRAWSRIPTAPVASWS